MSWLWLAWITLSLSPPTAVAPRPATSAPPRAAVAPPPAAAAVPLPSARLQPGARITLSLRDADLRDVLRSFAQLAGFDLVLDASVRGAVTVELHEVPWEQALAVILRSHGLGAEVDGGIWRLRPAAAD